MENNQQNTNRPQLKKIKRPIRRPDPLSSLQVASAPLPQSRTSSQPKQAVSGIVQSEDVDKYLDTSALPSTNVQPDSYSPKSVQYLDEDTYNEEIYGVVPQSSKVPEWLNTKTLVVLMICALFIGVVAGKIIFSGQRSSSRQSALRSSRKSPRLCAIYNESAKTRSICQRFL